MRRVNQNILVCNLIQTSGLRYVSRSCVWDLVTPNGENKYYMRCCLLALSEGGEENQYFNSYVH